MANAISTQLQGMDVGLISDFAFWGEAIRFLGVMTRWMSCQHETPELLFMGNFGGPFSHDEVVQYIAAYIASPQLSYAGDWPLEVARSVAVSIQTTVDEIRQLAAALPKGKSVPTIDETLRRLYGFMSVRGNKPTPLDADSPNSCPSQQ
jgi:hypothetical protein